MKKPTNDGIKKPKPIRKKPTEADDKTSLNPKWLQFKIDYTNLSKQVIKTTKLGSADENS